MPAGLGVFVLRLLCGALRLDMSAYRFAGITFAIVALVSRPEAPGAIALHQFVDVSIGILVALIGAAVWPAREPTGRGSPAP